jgi:hypothetical protein
VKVATINVKADTLLEVVDTKISKDLAIINQEMADTILEVVDIKTNKGQEIINQEMETINLETIIIIGHVKMVILIITTLVAKTILVLEDLILLTIMKALDQKVVPVQESLLYHEISNLYSHEIMIRIETTTMAQNLKMAIWSFES